MKDYRARFEKLIADAAECDMIGNLAGDANKRATFRQMAEQFRTMAVQVKAAMDGDSTSSLSDRQYLLRNAKDFRDLAAIAARSGDDALRDELLRMAADSEEKAAQEAPGGKGTH